MKQVASAASCKNINSRFCKSANTAAKTVLGVASSAFSDVRALYVGLTLALYGSAKTTSKQMTTADVAAAESEENEIEDVKARAGGSCAVHADTDLVHQFRVGLDERLVEGTIVAISFVHKHGGRDAYAVQIIGVEAQCLSGSLRLLVLRIKVGEWRAAAAATETSAGVQVAAELLAHAKQGQRVEASRAMMDEIQQTLGPSRGNAQAVDAV
ncbi:hypothetical protein JKP88DRAFT_354599 [Tribonema minus]|uniref:Uncharacterized protein n=1 Tax=Tribonema minus TaxID=303371 RepID=A0A835Z0N2_9STRA|nr:hypothetical protein JKP88DRAFT_354599 [Tribonema minus]